MADSKVYTSTADPTGGNPIAVVTVTNANSDAVDQQVISIGDATNGTIHAAVTASGLAVQVGTVTVTGTVQVTSVSVANASLTVAQGTAGASAWLINGAVTVTGTVANATGSATMGLVGLVTGSAVIGALATGTATLGQVQLATGSAVIGALATGTATLGQVQLATGSAVIGAIATGSATLGSVALVTGTAVVGAVTQSGSPWTINGSVSLATAAATIGQVVLATSGAVIGVIGTGAATLGQVYLATAAATIGQVVLATGATATILGKVAIVGNTGSAVDATGQNAASPANSLLVAGQFNTTPTTVSSGNVSPLQIDTNGNLLVNQVKARTAITLYFVSATGITSEALATMQINKGLVLSSGTAYTVTTGKTFRIQSIQCGGHLTTATNEVFSRVTVHCATAVTVASPTVAILETGTAETGTLISNSAFFPANQTFPEGFEVGSALQVGISHLEGATTCVLNVTVTGYEY